VPALTNPCGCYTPTYLSLNGKQIIDNPGTPPVKVYSVAVYLVAGQTYSLAISGDSSALTWATPSALAPGIAQAVAAANPHTVVVVDAGAPIVMPWLSQVAAVLDAWYPGETNGTSLARVLFGRVNPGGHLPVTFPESLSQVPASTPAQFPGTGGQVQYSEGLDVG
jgi:beta-glucosidase